MKRNNEAPADGRNPACFSTATTPRLKSRRPQKVNPTNAAGRQWQLHNSVLVEDIAKKDFPSQQLVGRKKDVTVVVKKKCFAAQEARSEKRRGRPSDRDEEEEE